MLTNPNCPLWVFEFFFRYTDRFEVENSKIIKEFLIFCLLDIERLKLINRRFLELIHNLCIYMLHPVTASDQVTLQVSCLLEICIGNRLAESLEECMDVVYVTHMTTILCQLNFPPALFDASSCKLPNHCAVNKVDVIYENLDTYYSFHRAKILHANSLEH